ncbi:MAG TPA: hypothetical protein VLX68_01715 [Chitinivibrionales bacterium]|nr:hypothetical protein [Chitinivibrionales bacterium]
MWFLGFYRLYVSLCCGIACYLFITKSIWLSLLVAAAFRALWFGIERILELILVDRDFKRHIYSFKQELGPYGIRLANKAEQDWRIKKSLAEVFVANPARLRKNVEQLTVMDTIFKAGMSPQGDDWLLHDCKLKYGSYRLAKLEKPAPLSA